MGDASAIHRPTLDRLTRMVGAETLAQITGLFFEHAPRRIATVRECRESGDTAGAAEALHALKSSAGMLGAQALQELAERMERHARAGEGASLWPLVDSLEREFEQAAAGLRTLDREGA